MAEQADQREQEQKQASDAAQAKDALPAAERDGDERSLNPEDQARVDEFLKRGVNSVERRPFRPLLLLVLLIAIVAGLSLFSQLLASWAGVY